LLNSLLSFKSETKLSRDAFQSNQEPAPDVARWFWSCCGPANAIKEDLTQPVVQSFAESLFE
jgi:hypothetical protein